MMDGDLAEFIQDSFESVWTVEILLTLHAEPTRLWSAEEIIRELRSSVVVVRRGLDGLLAAGLIVAEDDGRVRYGPASTNQERLVARLAETYRAKPAAVRRLVIQSPSDKLRTFSDAFRIRKE